MCWVLGLTLMLGFIGCRVHWAKTALGADSPPSCSLLLPACSFPSSGGWCRAGWALCSCCARSIVVGAAYYSGGMVVWGVEFHGDGGVSPSWIELVCDVSMVPVGRSAAVESPGWLFLRWEAVRLFARFCACGGFCWDAFGAEAD